MAHRKEDSEKSLLEGGDDLWTLLEKHKIFCSDDVSVYRACYSSFLHWRWACLIPSVLCFIWLVAKPDTLIRKLGDKKIAYFGIAVLGILLSWGITLRVIGRLIVNGRTFRKSIKNFKPGSHKESPTSHLLFGWIDYESLLWILLGLILPGTYPGYWSFLITMPSFLLIVISPPQFKARVIGNQYAKAFIETLRNRIQTSNSEDENLFAEILNEVRDLRKTLNMLYYSDMVYNAVEIFLSTVATIACAVVSVACAQSNQSLNYVVAAAFVSLFYGYNSINLLLELAQISDACLSATDGLLGDVLEHGRSVGKMSERSILQFNALKDEFRFTKFGAKVGIVIEQSVIFTASVSGAAALYSFISKLWTILHS